MPSRTARCRMNPLRLPCCAGKSSESRQRKFYRQMSYPDDCIHFIDMDFSLYNSAYCNNISLFINLAIFPIEAGALTDAGLFPLLRCPNFYLTIGTLNSPDIFVHFSSMLKVPLIAVSVISVTSNSATVRSWTEICTAVPFKTIFGVTWRSLSS